MKVWLLEDERGDSLVFATKEALIKDAYRADEYSDGAHPSSSDEAFEDWSLFLEDQQIHIREMDVIGTT
jgi:hypothetical protein